MVRNTTWAKVNVDQLEHLIIMGTEIPEICGRLSDLEYFKSINPLYQISSNRFTIICELKTKIGYDVTYEIMDKEYHQYRRNN